MASFQFKPLEPHREHYSGMGQTLTRAEAAHEPAHCYQARWNPAREDWDFNAGWEGALKLAREGWPEGAARVAAMARQLVEQVEARVAPLATQYGDGGGYAVDVARYLSGEPEHYLQFADQPAPKPVTLTVNLSASSAVSAERMFYRGAVILAAAEILTARGFAVTIQAKVASSSSRKADPAGPAYVATFNVREAGQAFDTDTLAFILCHPAFARRIVFALKEGTIGRTRGAMIQMRDGWAHGYGRPTDESADLYSKLYEPMMWCRKNQTHAGNAHRYDTEAARIARVLEICEAAGCEIRA